MFVASKILALLAQPLHWVVVLLALSALLGGQRRVLGRRLAAAALLLLLALGWQPLPDLLIRRLESAYPEFSPDADMSAFAGVLVLGGAMESGYLAQDHTQPLLGTGAERMTAAVALAQRNPGLRIVFTGGEGELLGTGPSEAERAQGFFKAMGLPPERLILEADSRNTFENAVLTARLPGMEISKRWLLLTSAWHMPRAMGSFRKAGWNVTAYPVDFRTASATPWSNYSLSQGAEKWQLVLRELLGLAAYRLAGRTD
jgi:uncharacterized SAM-binding protein YcdF (DUF218 family)